MIEDGNQWFCLLMSIAIGVTISYYAHKPMLDWMDKP